MRHTILHQTACTPWSKQHRCHLAYCALSASVDRAPHWLRFPMAVLYSREETIVVLLQALTWPACACPLGFGSWRAARQPCSAVTAWSKEDVNSGLCYRCPSASFHPCDQGCSMYATLHTLHVSSGPMIVMPMPCTLLFSPSVLLCLHVRQALPCR